MCDEEVYPCYHHVYIVIFSGNPVSSVI